MRTESPLRAILEELRDFDTALIANTIGYIDPTPPHQYYMGGSIKSVTPTLGPTVGVAVTCEVDTSTPRGKPDVAGYYQQLESMRKMALPTVWVVKCIGSRPDHECVIGDGMAKTLFSIGCIGVVTDGGVRDVNGLLSAPMATYCKGVTIHHAALRFRRMDQAIKIGGITVRTGDIIHANAEGVIRVPKPCLETLATKAIQMRAFEHAIHIVLRRTDLSLAEKQRRIEDIESKSGFADPVPEQKRRPRRHA